MNEFLKKSVFLFTMMLACILLLSGTIFSQSNKGSIIGTVKDPNDAVVPNAKVVITNIANGETRETTSDDGGDFAVTNLDPGTYKVTVESGGFKKLSLNNVTVETNARVPVNAKFTEVSGTGDNVVNVTADGAPLAESETSVRGTLLPDVK